MKRLLSSILMFTTLGTAAQFTQVDTAKDTLTVAYKIIGQYNEVCDQVYTGNVVNDIFSGSVHVISLAYMATGNDTNYVLTYNGENNASTTPQRKLNFKGNNEMINQMYSAFSKCLGEKKGAESSFKLNDSVIIKVATMQSFGAKRIELTFIVEGNALKGPWLNNALLKKLFGKK